MAQKKDFAGMNTGRVYSSIEQATSRKGQQGTASPQEAAERAAELKTQGRKGCKAIRINMAFTPENHEFIKVMSKASGKTMTEFTNLVIAAYQREHPEIMEQAAAFLNTINSGAFSSLLGGNADKEE
jgi:uncharacterized protein (DUF1778 family)